MFDAAHTRLRSEESAMCTAVTEHANAIRHHVLAGVSSATH
jgi:hypothetical protein